MRKATENCTGIVDKIHTSFPALSHTLLFGLFKKKLRSSLSVPQGLIFPGHCGKSGLKQVNFTLNSEDREVYSHSDVFQE